MNTVKYNRFHHRKTLKNNKKNKIIIGLIYANWCGHCQALKPEWKKMKNRIKSSKIRNKSHFVEIEDSNPQKDEKINKINTHLKGEKLAINGYPTIFKIKGGNLEYYKGGRSSNEMEQWFSNKEKQLHKPKQQQQRMNNNFVNMLGGKKEGGGCGCDKKIW